MTRAVAAICLALSGAVSAQEFSVVPEVVTASPAVFKELFTRARTAPLHAAFFGDSQEACPNSHGHLYIPAFNAALANRYGVSPRTPIVQAGQNFGVSAPPAEWLLSGRILYPYVSSPTPYLTPGALPGLADCSLPKPTGLQRGWAVLLQPRAFGVPLDNLDRSRRWFDDRSGVYIDVYTFKQSGRLRLRVSVCASLAPDPDTAVTSEFVVDPAAAAHAPGPVGVVRVGPVVCPADEEKFLQIEAIGDDESIPSRIVGLSLASVETGGGMTVTDIAGGGYNAGTIQSVHGPALSHLGGLEFDAAFVSFGANDGSFLSPVEYKFSLRGLVQAVRGRTRPDLPFILLTDPVNALWDDASRQRAAGYAGVAAELALELPGVCAVNSRRLTESAGWTAAGFQPFSYDGVHYTQVGATLKAELEVGALWERFVCGADIGSSGGFPRPDGVLDNNDFIVFIDAFFNGDPLADSGRQGGVSGADGVYNANDFVAFVDAFFSGC